MSGADLAVEVLHDFRSPLGSILMLARSLVQEDSSALTPVQRRHLAIVYSAALGLSTFASDLMELLRGTGELAETAPRAFSLRECLSQLRDVLQPLADATRLELRVRVRGADQRRGYPLALQRVLLNLATNALKYTERGSVEIAAQGVGRSRVHFSVSDTGRGLAPETVARIQAGLDAGAAPTPAHLSSSGLGLTIVMRLLQRQGARLTVCSEPGAGTRFEFELMLPRPAGPIAGPGPGGMVADQSSAV